MHLNIHAFTTTFSSNNYVKCSNIQILYYALHGKQLHAYFKFSVSHQGTNLQETQ